jgi:hypothetical protein
MEVIGQLAARSAGSAGGLFAARPGPAGLTSPLEVLRECSAALLDAAGTAVEEARLLDGGEAGEYACLVEELSRTVEFLQIVAAGLAQRVRQEALASPASGSTLTTNEGWGRNETSAAAIGWRTNETSAAAASTGGWGACNTGTSEGSWRRIGAVSAGAVSGGVAARVYRVGPGAAEFRNTAEYLRACLRISAGEARRRLTLAQAILPRTGLTGQPMPPVREALAEAMTTGAVSSKAATQITMTLENIRPLTDEATIIQVEHSLTSTAIDHDPEFLTSVAKRWTNAIDQDGGEPSEELLRQRQGAFLRRPRNGLQHLEVFATPDQFEHLITVMNTATNPRLPNTSTSTVTGTDESTAAAAGDTEAAATLFPDTDNSGTNGGALLDRRTRAQRMLDGIIGACKTALSAGTLPTAGGLRPQILVTIGYKELLADLNTTTNAHSTAGTSKSNTRTSSGTSGVFAFTGPVSAAVIRKMACDAELLPVVMGAKGKSWTSGAPPGSSRRTSAKPSPPATSAAPSPAAPCPHPGAKPTTSPTGHTAEPPAPATEPYSAPTTTT